MPSKAINGLMFQNVVHKENYNKLKFEELLFPKKYCLDCKEELIVGENWFKSHKRKQIHLCKKCARARSKEDYKKRKELAELAEKIEEDPLLRKRFWQTWLRT